LAQAFEKQRELLIASLKTDEPLSSVMSVPMEEIT
jgi:hypothetical protein